MRKRPLALSLLAICLLAGVAWVSRYGGSSGPPLTLAASEGEEAVGRPNPSVREQPAATSENKSTETTARARSQGPAQIRWLSDFDQALKQARLANKLVVIDFSATWCGPCKMMERTTFADEKVRQHMAGFVALKVDIDLQRKVAARYGVTSLPTTLVVDADGQPILGTVGFLEPRDYLRVLTGAQSKAKQPPQGILGRPAPSLGVDMWYNLPEGRESIDVNDYKGKIVYLYGFQSWCPSCHRYGFPTLVELIGHYKGNEDVAFIAVQTTFEGFGTNTSGKAKETADRYGLSVPVGHSGSSQQPSTVMRRYRTGGTPWTVIIDRHGVVRFNDFRIQPDAAVALIDQLLADDGL